VLLVPFLPVLQGIYNAATQMPSIPKDISKLLPVHKPTFGLSASAHDENKDKIKATWLGHACFLVELPRPAGAPNVTRGARILFDPVFSDRCSPFQWIGPKRFTREFSLLSVDTLLMVSIAAPCKLDEIPEIDAIVISVCFLQLVFFCAPSPVAHFMELWH
jgi:N-acyl-phosphatidylethanolamine-hydrolysing phospholipase D